MGRERRRLRKRTKISPHSRRLLESSFLDNSRPNTSQLVSLAEKTKLERDVVRVWFAIRRQKQKKQPSNPEIDFSNIQNLGDFFDDFDDPASDYDDLPGVGYQAGQKASVIVLN